MNGIKNIKTVSFTMVIGLHNFTFDWIHCSHKVCFLPLRIFNELCVANCETLKRSTKLSSILFISQWVLHQTCVFSVNLIIGCYTPRSFNVCMAWLFFHPSEVRILKQHRIPFRIIFRLDTIKGNPKLSVVDLLRLNTLRRNKTF